MTAWRRFAQALRRGPGSEPAPAPPGEIVSALAARLDAAAQRRLGRSLALRHVDGGPAMATQKIYLDAELVVRGSTAPPPA